MSRLVFGSANIGGIRGNRCLFGDQLTRRGALSALPRRAPVPIAFQGCARLVTQTHSRRNHPLSIINKIDMFLWKPVGETAS